MNVDELVKRGHEPASREALKALSKMLSCPGPGSFELHEGDVKMIPRFLCFAEHETVAVVLDSFLVGDIEGTSYFILSREASFQVCQRLLKRTGGAPSTRFSYGGRTGCLGGNGQRGHGELFAGIFASLGLDPCDTTSSAFLLG